MTVKRIEVTRFYACDGKEFDDADECHDYEMKRRVVLEDEIRKCRAQITSLKEQANESRLQFRLAQCEANEALDDGRMATFHKKMAEFYEGKTRYVYYKIKLRLERRNINNLINKYYLWYDGMRHKSMKAKAERKEKSLRWRQENTRDKWSTPYKIRVSKLPKEATHD